MSNFLPQSGHFTCLFVSGCESFLGVSFSWVCLFLNAESADMGVVGVAFLAISRPSTNAMTSIKLLFWMSRVLRASLRISGSAIPAKRTSLTDSVVKSAWTVPLHVHVTVAVNIQVSVLPFTLAAKVPNSSSGAWRSCMSSLLVPPKQQVISAQTVFLGPHSEGQRQACLNLEESSNEFVSRISNRRLDWVASVCVIFVKSWLNLWTKKSETMKRSRWRCCWDHSKQMWM